MKKLFLFILSAVSLLSGMAQIKQEGIVMQYNGTQQKSALGNVEIAVYGAAHALSDAKTGAFTLSFVTSKQGDALRFRQGYPRRSGYEVFNNETLNNWNLSTSRKLTVVLCTTEYMQQRKASLTKVTEAYYSKRLAQQKEELEKAQTAKRIADEEYAIKLQQIEDDYYEALENLDNYIDRFAHIDLSEVSDRERRILTLVDQGKIDEAIDEYDKLDLVSKRIQAKQNVVNARQGIAKLEQTMAANKLADDSLSMSLNNYINTLMLKGGKANYDKIGQMLRDVADADTTDYDAMNKCASFFMKQKKYDVALEYFLRIKSSLEKRADESNRQIELMAELCQNLGYVYEEMTDFNQAEAYLKYSLEQFSKLFEQSPEMYRDAYMTIHNTMGTFFFETQNFQRAIEYYTMSVEQAEILYGEYPEEYGMTLANMVYNLANVHSKVNDYAKAEAEFLRAEEQFRQEPDQAAMEVRDALARVQHRRGVLYMSTHQIEQAEELLQKANQLYKDLYDNNPDFYRYMYAVSFNSLGNLQMFIDGTKCNDYYFKALPLFEELYLQNIQAFGIELSRVYMNIGNGYGFTNEFDKTEEYYRKSLDIKEKLYEKYPDAFRFDVASSYCNMADMYCYTEKYEQAELYCMKSKPLFETLYEQEPEAFGQAYAIAFNTIAILYVKLKKYSVALEYINKALEAFPEGDIMNNTKGLVLLMQGNEKEALKQWNKVQKLNPDFLQQYPDDNGLYEGLKERKLVE